jgi:hypothetical protein
MLCISILGHDLCFHPCAGLALPVTAPPPLWRDHFDGEAASRWRAFDSTVDDATRGRGFWAAKLASNPRSNSAKTPELQSVRQVHRWLRQEGIALPNTAYGPQGRHVVWKLPIYMAVYGIMTNPIYAGAYAYGRSTHRIRLEQGRKRIVRGVRQTQENWSVLIRRLRRHNRPWCHSPE